jgi:hypothetical protein
MKKLIATIALAGLAASVFAQGYVNMGNGATTTVSTNGTVNYLGQAVSAGGTGLTTGSGGAPQGYYYALLVQSYSGSGPFAATGITTLGAEGWLVSGAYATNSLSAGRFGGGTDEPTTANAAPGADLQYIVLGWSANESTGANAATILASLSSGNWANLNGWVGISSVGQVASLAGAPPATASTLFGTSPGITSPFQLDSVQTVPEPATMALAALGGASLLLFRRKK